MTTLFSTRTFFAVPKRVLGIELAVFDYSVLHVLERILALKVEPVRDDVFRAHQKVFARRRDVRHVQAVCEPAELGRYYIAFGNDRALAFSERLYSVQLGLGYANVVGVPQRGATVRRHFAIFQRDRIVVPKRIPQIKKAVARLDRSALFERTFAVGFARKPANYLFRRVPDRKARAPRPLFYFQSSFVLNPLRAISFWIYSTAGMPLNT